MVERKNVAFFATASKSSYVVQGEPGWLRWVLALFVVLE